LQDPSQQTDTLRYGTTGILKPLKTLFYMTNGATLTEDLLVRIRKRDRQALGELYDRYAPGLRGVTLRILTQRDPAEHAVQEAFLHLWRAAAHDSPGTRGADKINGYGSGSAERQSRHPKFASHFPTAPANGAAPDGPQGTSVAAWLTLRARAAALARLRSARGADAPPELEVTARLVSWLPRTAEVEIVDRRRELLQKILNQLPKPQRELLEKLVFEGWSESEMAEQQHEPVAKVKSDLRAAMRFLRHRLRAVMGTWGANI